MASLRRRFTRLATRPSNAVAVVAALVSSLACGTRSAGVLPDDDASTGVVKIGGACNVTLEDVPVARAVHVPQGSALTFDTNPPSGGNHYPTWVAWGAHSTAIPRGNWVHNLEHGGVVLLYRCASRAACPDVAAQLEAVAATLPADPFCGGDNVHARVVVVPDPLLPADVAVAAAAWGHVLRATCVDAATMRAFYLAHFGQGTEAVCAQGVVGD